MLLSAVSGGACGVERYTSCKGGGGGGGLGCWEWKDGWGGLPGVDRDRTGGSQVHISKTKDHVGRTHEKLPYIFSTSCTTTEAYRLEDIFRLVKCDAKNKLQIRLSLERSRWNVRSQRGKGKLSLLSMARRALTELGRGRGGGCLGEGEPGGRGGSVVGPGTTMSSSAKL